MAARALALALVVACSGVASYTVPAPRLARRAALRQLGFGAAALAVGGGAAAGPAFAADAAPTADESLVMLLRVLECTEQEARLIGSGKFKDLQRANIKMATNMILTNYNLGDTVNALTKLVPADKQVEAVDHGRQAGEYLTTLLTYFDDSKKGLQVDEITADKKKFALQAFAAANTELLAFLTYLPADRVEAAKRQVAAENDANVREYEKAYNGEQLLNQPKK